VRAASSSRRKSNCSASHEHIGPNGCSSHEHDPRPQSTTQIGGPQCESTQPFSTRQPAQLSVAIDEDGDVTLADPNGPWGPLSLLPSAWETCCTAHRARTCGSSASKHSLSGRHCFESPSTHLGEVARGCEGRAFTEKLAVKRVPTAHSDELAITSSNPRDPHIPKTHIW
jgi:hypothetical protein